MDCKGCGQPGDELTAGCTNCSARHGMRRSNARRAGLPVPPVPKATKRLYRPPRAFGMLVRAELAEAKRRALECLADD